MAVAVAAGRRLETRRKYRDTTHIETSTLRKGDSSPTGPQGAQISTPPSTPKVVMIPRLGKTSGRLKKATRAQNELSTTPSQSMHASRHNTGYTFCVVPRASNGSKRKGTHRPWESTVELRSSNCHLYCMGGTEGKYRITAVQLENIKHDRRSYTAHHTTRPTTWRHLQLRLYPAYYGPSGHHSNRAFGNYTESTGKASTHQTGRTGSVRAATLYRQRETCPTTHSTGGNPERVPQNKL